MPGGFPISVGVCNGTSQGTATATSSGTILTSANTWIQLVAATPNDASLLAIQTATDQPATYIHNFDIGIGAAGSEVTLITNITTYFSTYITFPVQIPAGTRIAARITYGGFSALINASIQLYDAGYGSAISAGIDTIGFDATSHGGTPCPPSATANTKGAFTQLIASTARNYSYLVVQLNRGDLNPLSSTGRSSLTDIAIGGAGSEVVIIPNIVWYRGTDGQSSYIPVSIPAGTRISARCQVNAASGSNVNVIIWGM